MNIGKYVELYSKDLKLKNYADSSIKNYCSQVILFLNQHSSVANKPTEIAETQIKNWLLESKSANGRKHRISALKLFYKLTIGQPLKFKNIEYPRSEKKLPIVLSVEEIQRMFNVCENKKHKVILALLYSCGLRVSELINLRWCNIDRSRKIINIIGAKGKKDRQVMLPSTIIPLLESYYFEYLPKDYVLNGQFGIRYSDRSVGEVVKQLAYKAKIENKRVYTHLMRHCSFTHMVESGVDINLVQKLAGHNNVKTTMVYTHISHNLISAIQSPINSIKF
jgi:site-specific recombinase XerD